MYHLKSKINYYIIALLHCLIINGCAVVSSPTGGEKDTTPPKVKASLPANNSTNFSSKDISILFDEWITLQNPQNVLITPDVDPKPKITAKKNELQIQFKEKLDSNTTYSIFFGNELKDNNEGNPIDNYAYVFSTGAYIDSISVEGKLHNYEDKLPANAFVTLYKDLNDSAFTNKRPYYITKINTDGSFSLKNLKAGQYKIYALDDKNSNYYYDLPTEQIGFLDNKIVVDSNLENINIPFFLPEEENWRIVEKDKNIQNGKYNITWNKTFSPKEDQIQILTPNNINAIAFPEDKKLQLYFTNLQQDTGMQQFFIKHNDEIIDSIETKITSKKDLALFFDTTKTKNLKILESNSLQLISIFHSIQDIDTNKIQLIDSSGNKIEMNIERKEDLKTYIIKSSFKPAQNYKIIFQDSSLQDLAGKYNKMQEISFLVEENKKGGKLLINIELDTNYTNLIFILKDNQGNVLEKQNLRNSRSFKINIGLTQAGSHQAEFIKDDNDNEIWNSGNFSTKSLPEKTYKHTPIIVKENWDAEETIKPNFNQIQKATSENKNLKEEINQNNINKKNIPKENINNRIKSDR
ncbi:MAG: Ig-like domain-containing protein [Sphingobacteriales bacterium]|nr:MAG: Ig-like domain-containing protein [Sphingobacteriales bacterium]